MGSHLPSGRGDIPALTPAKLVGLHDLATPEGHKSEELTQLAGYPPKWYIHPKSVSQY